MAGNSSLSVEPVLDSDGHQVAVAFGARQAFWFLIEDERDDTPRGAYRSMEEAAVAALHQVQCMRIAENLEIMLDT